MNGVSSSWRRSVLAIAGGMAIALASWACSHDTGGSGAGTSGAGACGAGAGGAAHDAGQCEDPAAPVPPQKACTCGGDIFTQCPLPASVSNDDGEYTTVYYYSAPACVAGYCHYCVTSTMTEDPGVTGVP
jgi:hypothetical protein